MRCARGERGDVVIDARRLVGRRRRIVSRDENDAVRTRWFPGAIYWTTRRRRIASCDDETTTSRRRASSSRRLATSPRANDSPSVTDALCVTIALRMYGFCADELIVNDTRDVLVRGLGSFLGVHPSNDAFEESVRQVTESGARATPETHGPPNARRGRDPRTSRRRKVSMSTTCGCVAWPCFVEVKRKSSTRTYARSSRRRRDAVSVVVS